MNAKISVSTIPVGYRKWVVCTVIDLTDKRFLEVDVSMIFEQVTTNKILTVYVKGSLSENPDMKEVFAGLSSAGYKIIFHTSSDDSIESVRQIRNVSYIVDSEIPNEKENKINMNLIKLLKEDDELLLKLEGIMDVRKAIQYFKSVALSRPTVLFSVDKKETSTVAESLAGIKSTFPIKVL